MKPVKPRLYKVSHVWVAASRGHTNGHGDTPEAAAVDFEAHRRRRSRVSELHYRIQTLQYRIRTLEQTIEQNTKDAAGHRRRLEDEIALTKRMLVASAERTAEAEKLLRTAEQRARDDLQDELKRRERELRAKYEPYRQQYERLLAEQRNATRTRRATDVRTTAEQL